MAQAQGQQQAQRQAQGHVGRCEGSWKEAQLGEWHPGRCSCGRLWLCMARTRGTRHAAGLTRSAWRSSSRPGRRGRRGTARCSAAPQTHTRTRTRVTHACQAPRTRVTHTQPRKGLLTLSGTPARSMTVATAVPALQSALRGHNTPCVSCGAHCRLLGDDCACTLVVSG